MAVNPQGRYMGKLKVLPRSLMLASIAASTAHAAHSDWADVPEQQSAWLTPVPVPDDALTPRTSVVNMDLGHKPRRSSNSRTIRRPTDESELLRSLDGFDVDGHHDIDVYDDESPRGNRARSRNLTEFGGSFEDIISNAAVAGRILGVR